MAVATKLGAIGLAVVLALGACSGDDDVDESGEDDPVVDTSDVTPDTDPPDDETTTTTEATDGADIDAEVAIDPAALPSEPSGFDTLAGDLCVAYEVDELDTVFEGEGELAIEEPDTRGCRWAVEGFPRSHFVSLAVQPASDPDIYLTREEDVAGTTVLVNSTPAESRAWIPAPDGGGDLLAVAVHGEFGAPDGRLPDGYLDPAVFALVENLLARL